MLHFLVTVATFLAVCHSAGAQSTTVISIFGPDQPTAGALVASLVDVQNGLTTLQYSCSDDTDDEDNCFGVPATVTAGPSTYSLKVAASAGGESDSADINCKITGHTTGTCILIAGISTDGTSTTTTSTATLSSADITSVPITITAGNIAALTGAGTKTTKNAAPTVVHNNAMGAGAVGLAALLLL